jgi:hypothetical protein
MADNLKGKSSYNENKIVQQRGSFKPFVHKPLERHQRSVQESYADNVVHTFELTPGAKKRKEEREAREKELAHKRAVEKETKKLADKYGSISGRTNIIKKESYEVRGYEPITPSKKQCPYEAKNPGSKCINGECPYGGHILPRYPKCRYYTSCFNFPRCNKFLHDAEAIYNSREGLMSFDEIKREQFRDSECPYGTSCARNNCWYGYHTLEPRKSIGGIDDETFENDSNYSNESNESRMRQQLCRRENSCSDENCIRIHPDDYRGACNSHCQLQGTLISKENLGKRCKKNHPGSNKVGLCRNCGIMVTFPYNGSEPTGCKSKPAIQKN